MSASPRAAARTRLVNPSANRRQHDHAATSAASSITAFQPLRPSQLRRRAFLEVAARHFSPRRRAIDDSPRVVSKLRETAERVGGAMPRPFANSRRRRRRRGDDDPHLVPSPKTLVPRPRELVGSSPMYPHVSGIVSSAAFKVVEHRARTGDYYASRRVCAPSALDMNTTGAWMHRTPAASAA